MCRIVCTRCGHGVLILLGVETGKDDGRRIPFFLRNTRIFILVSFSFHVPGASDPFRPKALPFSASNLPVARNKPPLPWLLPCRIFPWVSTVAFLSHCIAPCHRDDDVGHYHDDSRGPRGWWRFVCLFSFPPPLRTHHLFGARSKVCVLLCRPYLRSFLRFWQLQINCVRLPTDEIIDFLFRYEKVSSFGNGQISGLYDCWKICGWICAWCARLIWRYFVGLGDI